MGQKRGLCVSARAPACQHTPRVQSRHRRHHPLLPSQVICTKVRDGDKRIVRLKEGAPKGRHVVVVDDLVQSGGTLIECQRLLKAQGAAHVSAYVTHGVFPRESFKRFKPENGNGAAADGFAYFWITDSCSQTVRLVRDMRPFEVLSLAEPIAAALQI